MSDKRYLGNIITQNPTAPADNFETTSAAGVWSLAEAFAYTKAGLWPTAGNVGPRGVFGGGNDVLASRLNTIDYISIASTGNTTDFGDLSVTFEQLASASSSTRGLFYNGNQNGGNPGFKNEYITIASTGNSTSFGNTVEARRDLTGFSNDTRACFAGGGNSSNNARNGIDYVTIASTGNAQILVICSS